MTTLLALAVWAGFVILCIPPGIVMLYWVFKVGAYVPKLRYFIWDPKGRYRGLFSIGPSHAAILRNKGWHCVRAGTPFGKAKPDDPQR